MWLFPEGNCSNKDLQCDVEVACLLLNIQFDVMILVQFSAQQQVDTFYLHTERQMPLTVKHCSINIRFESKERHFLLSTAYFPFVIHRKIRYMVHTTLLSQIIFMVCPTALWKLQLLKTSIFVPTPATMQSIIQMCNL